MNNASGKTMQLKLYPAPTKFNESSYSDKETRNRPFIIK